MAGLIKDYIALAESNQCIYSKYPIKSDRIWAFQYYADSFELLWRNRHGLGKGKCRIEGMAQYIELVVVGICLCLGYLIKHTLDFIANKYIPLILAITGIIINVWINRGEFNPEILLAGMVSGLASTGTFELVKNIRIKRLSEENKGSLEKETEKKEK